MTPSLHASDPEGPPTYAIGDLQGCHDQFVALLEQVRAITPDAQFIIVGDIVNRGPKSLETLRRVRDMALAGRVRIVLGNHDLNLLAIAAGLRQPHRSDTVDDILAADDRDELLTWLRHQPLARYEQGHLFVHAGVLPQWNAEQAVALAHEVENALQGNDWVAFLRQMYGHEPAKWHDDLRGADRLRCIVNALTRIRYCAADGAMDFKSKEGLIEASAADGLMPWFSLPNRHTADTPVVFGHWSTLGLIVLPNLIALDTGCVWGGQLTAVRLGDRKIVQIDCPQQQEPTLN
jgi:bis(5'-nucleosyl)-tetraphosphatase (symmetrical)